jgi:hypothetical protein
LLRRGRRGAGADKAGSGSKPGHGNAKTSYVRSPVSFDCQLTLRGWSPWVDVTLPGRCGGVSANLTCNVEPNTDAAPPRTPPVLRREQKKTLNGAAPVVVVSLQPFGSPAIRSEIKKDVRTVV